jgi:hypothetical protein
MTIVLLCCVALLTLMLVGAIILYFGLTDTHFRMVHAHEDMRRECDSLRQQNAYLREAMLKEPQPEYEHSDPIEIPLDDGGWG